MRCRIVLAFAVLAGVVAGGAAAITNGEPDNGAHPHVGLVVFYKDDVYLRRCTATLVGASVLLTAAHCAGLDEGAVAPDRAQVWFDEGPIAFDPEYRAAATANGGRHVDCFQDDGGAPAFPGYPCAGGTRGVPHAHPAWQGSLDDVHDIGVVVLDSAPPVATRGLLPPPGYLDALVASVPNGTVELGYVGYGLQSVKPTVSDVRERRRATGKLVSLNGAKSAGLFVKHSASPGHGGGTCFGDSGGPIIHDGHVVALFSFVQNLNCKGIGYSFRTDTAVAREFLSAFLAELTVAAAPAAPAGPAGTDAPAASGAGAGAAGASAPGGNGKGKGKGSGQ